MCCQHWSPICDLINLSFGLTTYYLLFWLTIYSFEWFWFDRNSWTGRCYAIQTGKRLRLRKWKEFHGMAWSLGNESIGLFNSSLLVCQKFWQMFKLVFFCDWICLFIIALWSEKTIRYCIRKLSRRMTFLHCDHKLHV